MIPRVLARKRSTPVVMSSIAALRSIAASCSFGTIDGRLIALDAITGARLWETQTTDNSKPYTITGAPRVVKNMVIIGNGGAEFGVRGYVSAYDVRDGK